MTHPEIKNFLTLQHEAIMGRKSMKGLEISVWLDAALTDAARYDDLREMVADIRNRFGEAK